MGLFDFFRQDGKQAFNKVLQRGAAASNNPAAQRAVDNHTKTTYKPPGRSKPSNNNRPSNRPSNIAKPYPVGKKPPAKKPDLKNISSASTPAIPRKQPPNIPSKKSSSFLDGLFDCFRQEGKGTLNQVLQTGAVASQNPAVQRAVNNATRTTPTTTNNVTNNAKPTTPVQPPPNKKYNIAWNPEDINKLPVMQVSFGPHKNPKKNPKKTPKNTAPSSRNKKYNIAWNPDDINKLPIIQVPSDQISNDNSPSSPKKPFTIATSSLSMASMGWTPNQNKGWNTAVSQLNNAKSAMSQQRNVTYQQKKPDLKKSTSTPFDGVYSVTKPIYDWGVGASKYWDKNVAPHIDNTLNAMPYLGPESSGFRKSSDGKIHSVPVPQLSNGGTRTNPNWNGNIGHEMVAGVSEDLPKHTLEFVTAAPAAVSWLGQETWKNPSAPIGIIGGGSVLVADSMVTAAKENPYRFAGEMGGGFLIGGKTAAIKKTTAISGIRGLAHLDPYFERNLQVYTGKPGPITALKRWQSPFKYHPTLRGSVKYELDPKIFEGPQNFYHGTSREFAIPEALSPDPIQISSNNPMAIPETIRAKANVAKGVVGKTEKAAVENALFLGPPDIGYGPFAEGAFLKVRAPVRDLPSELVHLAEKREGMSSAKQHIPKSLDKKLNIDAYGEYFNSPRGEMLVSPKPISGYKWKGIPEHEYVMKPGTNLYPVFSGRSRFWSRFGLSKGSSYTIHPKTGKIIEIQEYSTYPVKDLKNPDPWIDIPAISAKLPPLPSGILEPAIFAESTSLAGPKGQSLRHVSRSPYVLDADVNRFLTSYPSEGHIVKNPIINVRNDLVPENNFVREGAVVKRNRNNDPSARSHSELPEYYRPPDYKNRRGDYDPVPDYRRDGIRRDDYDPVPDYRRDDIRRDDYDPVPDYRRDDIRRDDDDIILNYYRDDIPRDDDELIIIPPPSHPPTTKPPKKTKPKKTKKPRKPTRDPYDWMVYNPVPDIESIFGAPGKQTKKTKKKTKKKSRKNSKKGNKRPADYSSAMEIKATDIDNIISPSFFM